MAHCPPGQIGGRLPKVTANPSRNYSVAKNARPHSDLSPKERENLSCAGETLTHWPATFPARPKAFPLLGGEGEGEGEPISCCIDMAKWSPDPNHRKIGLLALEEWSGPR